MNKRRILAFGSIAIGIIVLGVFTSVASAQSMIVHNESIYPIKHSIDKISEGEWFPGFLIVYIIVTLLLIFTPFN